MGEAPLSWAFSTTGKKCVNNAFQEWGEPCEMGDVVTAVLVIAAGRCFIIDNFQKIISAFLHVSTPIDYLSCQDFSSSCIAFFRNDECMGVAFSGVVLPDGDAVYAHVCVKNCKVGCRSNMNNF